MATDQLEVISDQPMALGECPLWHPEESALYWVDIDGLAVHRMDPATRTHRSWRLPSEPGCIAWSAGRIVIVALRTGVFELDTDSGKLTPVTAAPYDTARLRFNDGRCDAAGRFWIGTIYEPRDRPGGSLYVLNQGSLQDCSKPVTVSNGLAFSPDNRILYHADTSAHRITAWDFDLSAATIGGGRVLKQFASDRSASDYGGRPDGAAVDSEGAYWCAMYEGGCILRLSPSGEILRKVELPVRCPTMMAFGGPDLQTLYITSARNKRSAEELGRYPLSGHVLALRADVPGLPEPAYIR